MLMGQGLPLCGALDTTWPPCSQMRWQSFQEGGYFLNDQVDSHHLEGWWLMTESQNSVEFLKIKKKEEKSYFFRIWVCGLRFMPPVVSLSKRTVVCRHTHTPLASDLNGNACDILSVVMSAGNGSYFMNLGATVCLKLGGVYWSILRSGWVSSFTCGRLWYLSKRSHSFPASPVRAGQCITQYPWLCRLILIKS